MTIVYKSMRPVEQLLTDSSGVKHDDLILSVPQQMNRKTQPRLLGGITPGPDYNLGLPRNLLQVVEQLRILSFTFIRDRKVFLDMLAEPVATQFPSAGVSN